jgi:hypothetical protein
MHEALTPALAHWESFYVIVGSSGAALTGLQFVVIALIAESRRRSTSEEIGAFATPSIVHFGAVLLVSAVLSAPWQSLGSAAVVLGASGAAGVVYVGLVIRRARRQTSYRVVFEDLLFHFVLPFVAYATLVGAALTLARGPAPALFAIGAAALLLLFIGIHNAWDAVTFFVTLHSGESAER